MAKLSVNINRIATIRNERDGNVPDLVKTAIDMERFGTEGITVFYRQDRCPIVYEDVYDLKKVLTTKFNIVGYPSSDFICFVCAVKPAQVTLVSNLLGSFFPNLEWDPVHLELPIKDIIALFHASNIKTSILVEPDVCFIEEAVKTGTDHIELCTENYAKQYLTDPEEAITPYIRASEAAHQCGLKVNAGRDLSLENLKYFAQHIPHLHEVVIGHALICDALYFGLENAIQMYLSQLKQS
jgi:pyridoxine 5-phosphate synthase